MSEGDFWQRNKLRLTAFMVILSIVLAIAFWRSPAYALWEIRKAIDSKNLALFYKRIDVEALQRSAIDALATKTLSDSKTEKGFLENAGKNLSAGLAKISALTGTDLIKHEVELELQRNREKPSPLNPNLEKNMVRQFFHDAVSYTVENWEYDGDEVIVTTQISLLKMRKSYSLSFRMQKAESGNWQIRAFEGLSSLLTTYEFDRRAKVSDYNATLQAELASKLAFFGETRSESSALGSTLFVDTLFHNRFAESVVFIKGEIKGENLEASFESDQLIAPGTKKVFLVKKEQYLKPFDQKSQNFVLSFDYREVKLQSGRILKVVNDFDDLSF